MSKDTKKEKSEKNTKKEQKNNFMKGLKVELKKVTWPTRKELVSSTATVIFITLLLAIIVFALDFVFEKANTYGIEKLKSVVTASENSDNNQEVVEVPSENNEDSNTEANNEVSNESNSENQVQNTDAENNSTETQPEATEGTTENPAQ